MVSLVFSDCKGIVNLGLDLFAGAAVGGGALFFVIGDVETLTHKAKGGGSPANPPLKTGLLTGGA
jgi:hypothetical protein